MFSVCINNNNFFNVKNLFKVKLLEVDFYNIVLIPQQNPI